MDAVRVECREDASIRAGWFAEDYRGERLVWHSGAARAEPAVTLDEAVLASYAGEYQQGQDRTYTIARGATVIGLEFGFGEGETPIQVKKTR